MFRQRLRSLPLILIALATPLATASASTPPNAADFAGATRWINSPPLSRPSLRGKVVLVDFWAFECINCLHALPEVKSLYARYKDQGLVVIGVHTPELAAERDTANVLDAVQRLGVTYPVAQDNDYAIWNAWHNQYWPAQYVVDARGRVTYSHIGEGGYAAIEAAVRSALGLPPLLRAAH